MNSIIIQERDENQESIEFYETDVYDDDNEQNLNVSEKDMNFAWQIMVDDQRNFQDSLKDKFQAEI